MAVMSERPYSGANFLVTIGDADPHALTAGFSEVIFPPFVHEGMLDDGDAPPATRLLVLRRAVMGSLDLYEWWDEWRSAKAPSRRSITVELLADDRRTVVMTWYFVDVTPVSLEYSPLRAVEGGLVIETISIAFARVEME